MIGLIVVIGPYLTEKVFAFSVNVNLSNKPFGDSSVWVEAQGPDGYKMVIGIIGLL